MYRCLEDCSVEPVSHSIETAIEPGEGDQQEETALQTRGCAEFKVTLHSF